MLLGHFPSPVSNLSVDSKSKEDKKKRRKYSTILNELAMHTTCDTILNKLALL